MRSAVVDAAALAPTWIPSPERDDGPDDSTCPPHLQSTDPADDLPRRSPSAPVHLVADRDSQSSERGEALLRARLTAAAWVIVCSLGLLFVRSAWLGEPLVAWLRSTVLIFCIGALVLLRGWRSLSVSQLRVIELGLFGVAGAQFVAMQLHALMHCCARHDAVQLTWTMNLGTVGFVMQLLAYGMFMPNGWKRTALMIVAPTLAPVGTLWYVRYVNPFASAAISDWQVLETAAILLVSAAIAVYGTTTIAALRQEVRRARRFGQYRLLERIGRGGMGEVFLAEHELLKRPCALKLVRTDQCADPLAFSRFEREVCAIARLSHWHTVDIYDYGRTDDGTFYYVMEHLRGLNLGELVQEFGPLPPARAIHFVAEACEALQEMHDKGLIHRDLKPANIFAAQRGGVWDVTKVLDLGLVLDGSATAGDDRREPGPFAGSPAFMAPEQADGKRPVDRRSDVYALGAVAYFLLTGRPPFSGQTPVQLIIAHARDPVTPPSQLNSDVPADLERVVLRCLEKQPDRRYSSARRLRRALLSCRDASGWTPDAAAQWWRDHAPEPPRSAPSTAGGAR